MRKIIAFTLTGAVVFSTIVRDAIPVYALENITGPGIEIRADKSYDGSVVIDAASDEDADALLDGYINMLVSAEKDSEEDVAPEGVTRSESLNPINRYLYDFLAKKASEAAKGSLSSTSFETGSIDLIPFYDGQYSFTKEELGVSDLNSQAACDAALGKTGIDISKVTKALLADYPYELYWWDKVSGFHYSYAPMMNISGNRLSVESISYTFRMYVSADYSVGSGIKTTDVDTNKTRAASGTVDKAKKVVKDALDNDCTSDYKKLKFYKKYICDNTSYNYDAVGRSTAFSNPWQVIYVFDEDPSTKVVCEGYSKAFKLLCDLSSFDYASLDCYLMSGLMSTTSHPTGENHMWNMVKMNDGKNYLVDVTNCDNDDGVSDDRLFLVGNASSGAAGFSISRPKLAISSTSFFPQDTVNYSYDSSTLATFTDTERKIAGSNYDPATEPEPEPETKVVVEFDKHEITLASLRDSTATITATVRGKGYSANSLIWSSSDEKTATVKHGIVTAAEGLTEVATAVITAETTDHKYKDTCTVTVTPAGQTRVPVTGVKPGEVEEGTVIELSGESSDTRILYTVDGNIPAVDNDGNPVGTTMLYSGGIRIIKDTVIKAIAVRDGCKNSLVAEFAYTIKQSSTVSDNVINVRLVAGGKVNNAEIAKSSNDGKQYKINIVNNKVAAISNKGVIQGKKAGNTTATVIKKDKEYKLNITVVAAGFTKKSYTVNVGDVINPVFKSEGVNISSYASNKPEIASVFPTTDGLYVIAKTKGSAKITAICDGKKYNVTVKVFDPCIAGPDILLIDNKTASLSVKNGTGKTTEWKSDNEAVLTVMNGKIKGVSKGSATVTAINNGRTMEKKINVYKLPEFGQKLYETSVDKPIEVILTRDSDMGEPVYSVSNKKVATIDEKGILTPVKKGTVTVTALIGGKKYKTIVKIK